MAEHDERLLERVRSLAQDLPVDRPEIGPVLRRARRRRLLTKAATTTATLALALGVIVPLRAILPIGEGDTPSAQDVLQPAPRDCPVGLGLIRGGSVGPERFRELMHGYLPGWLPDGFGLLRSIGPAGALDGYDATGIWSDGRCREVTLTFNSAFRNPAHGPGPGPYDPGVPQVGPWSLTADAAGGCSNAILGVARCLDYAAVTPDGVLSINMMGLEREEGDRIALSILDGESSPAPATQSVIVPDLVGLTDQQAMRTLDELGLKWVVAYRTVEGIEPWHVAGVDPAPGTNVDPGAAVELLVATKVTPLPNGAAEALDCEPDLREPFGGPRLRILPGGSAYIVGNIPGIGRDDRVAQSTSEAEQWHGLWHVFRDRAVIAVVDYPSLDGVACIGTGVAGA